MERVELTDGQWRLVEPLPPPERAGPGRPSRGSRTIVDVILWVHRTGSPWRDLPKAFGPWRSAWTRFDRWARAGVWQRALERLARRRDCRVYMVDGSIARAHQHASGARRMPGCQAIGRSRGGPSTKLHAIVEARGLPVEVLITPGQTSDYERAEALIEGRAGEAVIADRGYDADRVVELIERQGSKAVIPPHRHRCTKPRAFDAQLYRLRHRVEFFSNGLKRFRRVATRYDKTARNYLVMVQLGCIRIWTRFEDAL